MGSALKTGKSRTRLFPVSLSRFATLTKGWQNATMFI